MRLMNWACLLTVLVVAVVLVGCGGEENATTVDFNKIQAIKNIPGFKYLKEETFTCGGQTNTVKIYLHEKTGLNFVLLPGKEEIKPFLICQIEVTQSAWKKVMGTTPWYDKENVKEGDDYPATYLSWEDCDSFCKKTDLLLPTEIE